MEDFVVGVIKDVGLDVDVFCEDFYFDILEYEVVIKFIVFFDNEVFGIWWYYCCLVN